ncbi:transcription factor grauzone-like [Armigeres subalbatus]|uniref:transcription factor grauzone-like n=1 Tax=Armigeres subalbatus TaxID=124917 RepID=UPI002ED5FB63
MELQSEQLVPNNCCFTCLRRSDDYLHIVSGDGETSESKPIAELLVKHFWFKQADFVSTSQSVICQICWARVDEFHQFYLEVERNHRDVDPTKAEVKHEVSGCSEDLDVPPPVEVVVKIESTNEEEPEQDSEDDGQPDRNSEDDDRSEQQPPEETTVVIVDRKPKRKYTKRIKTENPVAKPKGTYQVKDAKQLAEEDEIIKAHVKYICEICGMNCPTFTLFQKHSKVAHEIQGCITCCGTRYHKKVRLLEHVQRLQDPNCFKCDICNKSFVNSRGIRRHKEEMHVPDELRIYGCDRCPKRFTKKSQLAYHLKGHDTLDNESAKCPQCERTFQTESQLKVHIKIRHTRPTDFICDVCAKGFYSKAEFQRHKKQHEMRPEELRVQCDICQMWLKNALCWRKHYRRHNQGPTACDLCGHISPNATALTSHKRHRHRTERNHTCQECGKQFKRPLGLREHMASHTGEALYTCSFCDKTFNSNANMFSHRKKMHPKEWLEQRTAQLEAQRGVAPASVQ